MKYPSRMRRLLQWGGLLTCFTLAAAWGVAPDKVSAGKAVRMEWHEANALVCPCGEGTRSEVMYCQPVRFRLFFEEIT